MPADGPSQPPVPGDLVRLASAQAFSAARRPPPAAALAPLPLSSSPRAAHPAFPPDQISARSPFATAMALAAIARASRPHTPNAYKLLLPRDPRASAIILHRLPIIRRKAGERLQLTSVPRLGKLFPHAADGKERTLRLKRMIQRERRVIQDHFPHLRSRTFVRGRQEKLVRSPFFESRLTCCVRRGFQTDQAMRPLLRSLPQQPGSTPKKWVPIADRIPFFNLRAGDSVRVTAGHEKIMWASKKEVIEAAKADAKIRVEDTRDKIEMARKRIEKDGRVVTQENEEAWERELTEVKKTAQRKLRAAEAMVASGPENKLYPRIFKIRRIDKAKAQVYLDGLHVRPRHCPFWIVSERQLPPVRRRR